MKEKEIIVQNLTYKDLRYWVIDCKYVVPIITTFSDGERYVMSTDEICISNDTYFMSSSNSVHFAISDFVVIDNLIDANVGSMDMCIVSKDLLEDKEYWHFIADEACIELSEDMLMHFFSYINHKMDIKSKDISSKATRSKATRSKATRSKATRSKATSSKAARSKNMDFNEVIKMQMMMKMMKSDKDFDISKMLIMQAMTSGREINLSEVMKAKILSSLMENGTDNVPAEKLALIKMVESGSFDITDYLKTKMSLSMIEDPEDFDENKLMLINMLDSNADINDIIKMKMFTKMFNSDTKEETSGTED